LQKVNLVKKNYKKEVNIMARNQKIEKMEKTIS